MKSFGATLAFTHERNRALLKAYRHHIHHCSHINLPSIGRLIVDSPAPRFWVSEDRATAVVSAIMRGHPVLDAMRLSKREMFHEIYIRTMELKQTHPRAHLCELVSRVINSPAPKFYMEPSSALQYIFKIRNGWYERNTNRNIGRK